MARPFAVQQLGHLPGGDAEAASDLATGHALPAQLAGRVIRAPGVVGIQLIDGRIDPNDGKGRVTAGIGHGDTFSPRTDTSWSCPQSRLAGERSRPPAADGAGSTWLPAPRALS